ncbi:MAG: cytochrome P460 family protein [Alphaproteobacteria bacterium]|nr:cytochrome P460 family protein [Alphaproteobacteria bacterium]
MAKASWFSTLRGVFATTIAAGAAVAVVLAASGGTAFSAQKQNKYTAKVPDGLAMSEFKGYEDWQVVGVSQTEDTLKVIVANPTMIKAYRAGVPENGKHFPDGAKIAKIEWSTQKDAESPFPVWVPDTLKGVGFIAKDSKRFPDSGGWGYAQFKTDVSGALMPDGSGTKCGFACHSTVAAKDYIFTGYAPR